jgi:hypothetical protein
MLAFAIFGSSRHLVVGADSATAAVLAVGLGGIAAAGAPASAQGLRWGPCSLDVRYLDDRCPSDQLGFIANFLSHGVLIGFLTGVGSGSARAIRRLVQREREQRHTSSSATR